jgi:hypothetical protein
MRLFQQLGISIWNQFLPEECNALTKGQVAEKLNEADQITATPTTVAIKQILTGVHIERRTGFWM